MNEDLQRVLGQIINNQLMTMTKLDNITKVLSDLTNTIIKYDNSYNEEMLKTQRVE